MLNLGSIQINEDVVIRQLERDLIDDWFQDPRKFDDMLDQGLVTSIIAKNFDQNHGVYKACDRSVLNVPKPNFTLRYGLETSITDRAFYHALTTYLIPFYDPLIPWNVFSHRYNADYKQEKYLFKRGVPAWSSFVGNVKAAINTWPVLLSTDLTNYFDNIDIVYLKSVMLDLLPSVQADAGQKGQIRSHIDALFECLKYWCHSERYGLPQNRDASSFLANMYMLEIDRHMLAQGYQYFRYMDDIKITCTDKFHARRALKELSLQLRKLGLSVNSGKTEICDASETEKINKHLDSGGSELQQIDAIWRTRSLAYISRSFPQLQAFTLRLLNEGEIDSREFRYCIKRLEILAHCEEFEVPDEYFAPITPLVIDAIPNFPAVTDQFVKYLLAVPTTAADLDRIAQYLQDTSKSFYNWQNYKLWLLLVHKEYRNTVLLEYAADLIQKNPDNPTRCGATLYLGALGGADQRVLIAKNFQSVQSFFGQRTALIAMHELPYDPYIKDHVKPTLREDLQTVYRGLRQFRKYITLPEKTHISSIIDDERVS